MRARTVQATPGVCASMKGALLSTTFLLLLLLLAPSRGDHPSALWDPTLNLLGDSEKEPEQLKSLQGKRIWLAVSLDDAAEPSGKTLQDLQTVARSFYEMRRTVKKFFIVLLILNLIFLGITALLWVLSCAKLIQSTFWARTGKPASEEDATDLGKA